jgi:hypothetical protein
LTSVVFEAPASCRRIEACAFESSSLSSIEIPVTVQVLESRSFAECHALASVSFVEGSQLRVIESSAFQGAPLAVIALPPSVSILESYCFDCLGYRIQKV